MLKSRYKTSCGRCRKNGIIKIPEALFKKAEAIAIEALRMYQEARASRSEDPRGSASSILTDQDMPYGLLGIGSLYVTVRPLPDAGGWFVAPSLIEIHPGTARHPISLSWLRYVLRHELRHFIQFSLGQRGRFLKIVQDRDIKYLAQFGRWGKPKETRGMPPRKARGKSTEAQVFGGAAQGVPWEHAVRDIEFQTRLADEVELYADSVASGDYTPEDALRKLVDTPSFRVWREHAPEKFRAGMKSAAAEFHAIAAKNAPVKKDWLGRPLTPLREKLQSKIKQKAAGNQALGQVRADFDAHNRPIYRVYTKDGQKTEKYAYTKEKAQALVEKLNRGKA